MKCPLCGGEDFENIVDWYNTINKDRQPNLQALGIAESGVSFTFLKIGRWDRTEERNYNLLECKGCGFAMIMRRK